jgi:hypothetical protein
MDFPPLQLGVRGLKLLSLVLKFRLIQTLDFFPCPATFLGRRFSCISRLSRFPFFVPFALFYAGVFAVSYRFHTNRLLPGARFVIGS